MIEIGIACQNHGRYAEISSFAQNAYRKRLGAAIPARPDLFAYACEGGTPIGCFGLYTASAQGPLMFETYIQNAFEKLAGSFQPRCQLAELGTRVVCHRSGTVSLQISIAMTAVLVIAAHANGIRYVGFTTNRLVRRITDTLGFSLIELGKPNFSSTDATFRKNWEQFFKTPQRCAGFHIHSLEGCQRVLGRFASANFEIRTSSACPLPCYHNQDRA